MKAIMVVKKATRTTRMRTAASERRFSFMAQSIEQENMKRTRLGDHTTRHPVRDREMRRAGGRSG